MLFNKIIVASLVCAGLGILTTIDFINTKLAPTNKTITNYEMVATNDQLNLRSSHHTESKDILKSKWTLFIGERKLLNFHSLLCIGADSNDPARKFVLLSSKPSSNLLPQGRQVLLTSKPIKEQPANTISIKSVTLPSGKVEKAWTTIEKTLRIMLAQEIAKLQQLQQSQSLPRSLPSSPHNSDMASPMKISESRDKLSSESSPLSSTL